MALTKITGQVINDTTGLVVGVTTVGGGVSAVDGFFSGIVTFSNDVSIAGTLTYEDVTNIDAVGLVTARNGIVVGSGITLSKDGDGFFTGVVTATSYAGDGSGLTGIAATDNVRTGILDVAGVGTFRNDVNIPDKIIHLGDTDTAIRFPAADTVSVETGGTERVRIDSSGRMGIGDNSPDRELVVKHASSNSTIKIESANTHTSQLMFADSDGEQVGRVAVFHGSGQVTSNSLTLDTAGTARIRVEPAGNVNVAQNLKVAGVCTATSFSGSGANLTSLPTYTEYSTQTVSGASTYSITITGDPKVFEVSLFEVRHVASQNIMYRLSNSGGETTSGYYDIGSAWRHDHNSNSTSRGLNQGQGCLVNYNFNGVNNLITGKAVFTKVSTGLYTFTGCYNHYFHSNEGSTSQYNLLSNGHINNNQNSGSTVTQIRIFTSGGGNFTSGTINVRGIA